MIQRAAWRRTLVILSFALTVWGALVAVTGGIGFRYGPIFFSSRGPRNSLILAVVFATLAWTLSTPGARNLSARQDWVWLAAGLRALAQRWWRRLNHAEAALVAWIPPWTAPIAAAALSIAITVLGFREGALVAAAADGWGYASQADLWLDGSLRMHQPLARELSEGIPPDALAPLAYRVSLERMDLVPAVGPGLPMVMALFAFVGGRPAVFYLVPLLAGVAIAATYLLGSRLAGRWTGLAAAVLAASSPSFLFQLTSSPMSDIPAMAWWGASLACLFAGGRLAALGSGAAAALAVLTRPNLAPLVVIPGLVWLWRALRARAAGRAPACALLFGAAVVPAAITLAALNQFWYGSPTSSGYGDVSGLYSLTNVGLNLARYPRWLVESQTPFVLLALAAPFVLRRRGTAAMAGLLLIWTAAVLASYLPYIPFDAWWFLRFLLPAYPALLALMAAVLVWLAGRLPRGVRVIAAVIAIALLARHGVTYAQVRGTFLSETEYKYEIAGRYVAEHLPERAMLLAMQHSGSARYYSGRPTLRWDRIPADRIDWAIAEIERHGYAPYAVIEDWEEEMWRQQLSGQAVVAALDRPPIVTLRLGNVRIYSLGREPAEEPLDASQR